MLIRIYLLFLLYPLTSWAPPMNLDGALELVVGVCDPSGVFCERN